jgi:hypothetical protein
MSNELKIKVWKRYPKKKCPRVNQHERRAEMEPIPKTWKKYLKHVEQLMAHIKTYDQEIYETKIEGDSIKIKIYLLFF